MKAKDLREMTIEELEMLVLEQKEKLYKLRFQLELSQLDDPSQIRQVKRDIARIKTLIQEKSHGLMIGSGSSSDRKVK